MLDLGPGELCRPEKRGVLISVGYISTVLHRRAPSLPVLVALLFFT